MRNSYCLMALLGAVAQAEVSREKKDHCRALDISGGGSNGACNSGVLWGFVNYGDPEDFAYDVVTGISAGSINAQALAGWEVGQEVKAFAWVSQLWLDLHTSDFWKNWTIPIVEGFFNKAGMVDNSPLQSYLQIVAVTFEGFKRRTVIQTCNVGTGEITIFD